MKASETGLDEDEAVVCAWVALARHHVTTDQPPLAVAATHRHRVPGRLALVHAVAATPSPSPSPSLHRTSGGGGAAVRPQKTAKRRQLLTLNADHATGSQRPRPIVARARRPRLRHLELGAVPEHMRIFFEVHRPIRSRQPATDPQGSPWLACRTPMGCKRRGGALLFCQNVVDF